MEEKQVQKITMLKILFISRAYPPVVGGIESQNYELSVWLSMLADVKIIANKKGRWFLPIFAPYALIKALFLFGKYDAVLLGDGVLGIIGWKLKLFYKKPVIAIIHGLDLTYKNIFYQKIWVNVFLKKIDKLIAVGNETARVAVEKGLDAKKIIFIPNGVDTEKNLVAVTRKDVEKIVGENLENKKIILTSGRLAKRKGVAWFINNVMPQLPDDVIYIVAGDGPDRENILRAVEKNNLQNRVKMLGYIPDEQRNILFNACDIFVQPNIKVPGDMEGFGISVIEAASCRLPVIASRLEGLQDAIKDRENGFLVESENAGDWVEKINELLADEQFRRNFGEKARQFVVENYSWEKISKKYLEEIGLVISKSKF